MRMGLFSILALAALVAGAAPAAIFPVNATTDAVDATPGDGVCDTAGAGLVCTLRAAVMEANALAGDDVIQLGVATYALTLAGLDETSAAGDLDVFSNVRIEGAGMDQTVIEQTTGDRVFEVSFTGGTLELADLTVQGGDCAGNPSSFGGGIRNVDTLHLERVAVRGNRGQIGGGVYNFKVMTGVDVVFEGNEATNRAGGLASASTSGSGGPGTTLVLSNATIGPNASVSFPTEAELANAERATLTNVTVSPFDTGMESLFLGNQDVELVHATVLGGVSTYSFNTSHTVTFTNSAVQSCAGGVPAVIVRQGVNASLDASCGFAAAGGIEGPFGLEPLADNGGPTPTHLPGPGSALIDAAPTTPYCVETDQRDFPRPNGLCDIGAVEVPESPATLAAAGAFAALVALARRKGRA
jgi:hypothetical protein